MEQSKLTTPLYYAAFLALCLALMPWAMKFFTYAINVDIAFLTLSAERMLSGLSMSEAYYDTNPPLSIIVQIPAVLIHKTAGVPLYYATTIYIFILLGLSLLATNTLLKKIDNITTAQRVIILSVLLIMSTLKPGYDFGQKDHILGMALFPLVLSQILITKRIGFNKILMWCVLLSGSLLILLKPHYGLVPAAIFLHRIIYQKRFSVFTDVDFITLAGMAIGYVAFVFIAFPDFVSLILPDILKYYASDISPSVIQVGIILMVQAIIPLVVCQMFLKDATPLISAFSAIAVLCIVPFILQGKGWAYHAIPADMFFYCSAGLLIAHLSQLGMKAIRVNKCTEVIGFAVVLGLLFWMVSQYYKKTIDIPTHDSYANTPFAKQIVECGDDCSFLFLHDMINVSQELSVYTGRPHASRFPTMWFVPLLLNAQNNLDTGKETLLSQDEINSETQKYTNMMAEDFERYQPDLIFVGLVPDPSKDGALFDFKEYLLEKNPEKFQPIWDQYTLEQTVDVDRLLYMERKKPGEDLITYRIYRKKNQIEKGTTMTNAQKTRRKKNRSVYAPTPILAEEETHILAILVNNEPGVLARVIGLFSGRGYNIESLTVAETNHIEHLSRITIVCRGTPNVIHQIKTQLERLVPVLEVSDLSVECAHVERELALVKVACTGEKRIEALRSADIFRARAVDSTLESFVFEITGTTEKINAFIDLMMPLGLVDISRTGIAAISRGKDPIGA